MAESNSRWPAYARVPPFLPVPLRARDDGWTPGRQARFIGFLAETGSVAEAARRAGMSREAAWRLRRRPGAESFAHAWDTVIALHRGAARDSDALPRRKITLGELRGLAFDGAFHVTMRRRKFVRAAQTERFRASEPDEADLRGPLAHGAGAMIAAKFTRHIHPRSAQTSREGRPSA